ncbi:MAG: hypothetical protein NTZ55_05020, partial [Candidatus Roizmanbacteria bacterium]|nr:hypothetical protein [Candidatus Roizmanbacteria bacterium]
EALYKEIQKQLASDKNMSYYRYLEASGDPVIKKERILLKELNANHDVVDVIQFPDDHEPFLTERRQMFREYLERGLLLSSDEFAKVVKKYSSTGVFSFTEYKMDYPEKIANQPDDIFGLENRINYIRKQHPELSHYFDLAEVYDLENKSLIRRQILLELVENSLFDRLIGEAIYSRDQFQKFLKEGEFSTVITVDLKFIKEINEKMSYADADMAIKSVWELIKDSLTPEDREKIIVGRFGGTFVLGIRQGETINERALYNLQHITGITFGHGINTFHVPVAMTNTDLTAINEKQVDSDQNEIFKNILKENETQFYERLLLDILEEDMMMRTVPRFIGYLKHANLELIPNDIPLTKRDLYALYLRGKRKLERLPKLQSVYHFNQDGDYTDSLLDIDRLHKEFIDSVNIFRLYSSGYVGSVDVPKEELRARVEFLNSIHT